MDRDAKLECLTAWLIDDCRCDLVAVDEFTRAEAEAFIVLECWTADHRAFRYSWSGDAFDQLSIEFISGQVHRAYRRARGFQVPEWAE